MHGAPVAQGHLAQEKGDEERKHAEGHRPEEDRVQRMRERLDEARVDARGKACSRAGLAWRSVAALPEPSRTLAGSSRGSQ